MFEIKGSSRVSRRFFLAAGTAACMGLSRRGMAADRAPASTGDDALLQRLATPNKYPELVLAPSYEPGAYDALAIDCPFVFQHDNRYYMTHIGFDGTGYRTGLASSDDLLHWKKEGLILDRGPAGSVTEFNVALTWILRDNDLFGAGALKPVNGRFLGTYHAYPKPGYESGAAVIGLCWSEDLFHWTLDPPFLRASDNEAISWEQGGLYKSCLIEEDGVYYLFYNAKTQGEPWIEQIGMVWSKDLYTWKRFPGNPVVPVGAKGNFDDIFCSDPAVFRVGKSWAMFFYTLSSNGKALDSVAFSDDLKHWRKSNKILIPTGPEGSIDSRYAHKPAAFVKDGKLYHFYCAVSPIPPKTVGEQSTRESRGIAVAFS